MLAFSLYFSATSATWIHLGPELGKALALAFDDDLPEFSEAPGPVEYGSNPTRDEGGRNGLWTSGDQTSLDELTAAENGSTLFPEASTFDPYGNMGQHEEPSAEEQPPTASPEAFPPSSGVDPTPTTSTTTGTTSATTTGTTTGTTSSTTTGTTSSTTTGTTTATTTGTTGSTGSTTGGGGGDMGGSFPWEGHAPGGGTSNASGTVNTNTGNRFTEVPIVAWDCEGSLSVDFTLYHNSRGVSAPFMGNKWRTSLDFYVYQKNVPISPGQKREALVRWPDGKLVKYTETAYGSNQYKGPPGIYEKLQRSPTGESYATWGLFTKDHTKYLFDYRGYLIRVKDRNGNQILIGRDTMGRFLGLTDSAVRSINVTYGSNGCISGIMDPTGRNWSFTYDAAKNMTGVVYPHLGGPTFTRQFFYDARSNITKERDLRGKDWNCTYDTSDRLTSWSNPLNQTVNFTYSGSQTTYTLPAGGNVIHNYSSGQLVSEVDPNGYSTAYGYDTGRNMNMVKDKNGGRWGYQYTANGDVQREQDPTVYGTSLYTHVYTYDGYGNLYSDTNRASHYRQYFYNTPAKGLLQRVEYRPSSSSGDVTVLLTNQYDSKGQLTQTHPIGKKITNLIYNGQGDVVQADMSGGLLAAFGYTTLGWRYSIQRMPYDAVTYGFDNWGRLTSTTVGSDTSSITYDLEDNVTNIVDENNHGNSFGYNDAMRLTTKANGRGDVESYSYNANGWLSSLTNGRGKTRTYTYTLRGDRKKMTLPDGYFEDSTFDPNGNTIAYQNPLLKSNLDQIQYSYNALDAMTGINYPPGTADVSFTYNILQQIASMTDGTGTTNWTYDSKERLSNLGLPGGGFAYWFDSSWRRSSMISSEGTTSYTYSNGELASLTNPHGETTSWTYDSYGRLFRQTLSTGSYTDYGYDSRGRRSSIVHRKSDNSVLNQEGYVYDPVGNMLSKTVDAVTTNYSYDNADQLTSEIRPGYNASYSYDGNGNRLAKVLNGVIEAYTYDDGDKLLTAGTKSYTYDLAGRTMSVTSPSGTTNLWYDHEDRLTQVTAPGGATQTYSYNGLDARRTKTNGGTTFNYKRAGVSPTAPVLSDGQATYTPGVSERRGGLTKWTQQDYLGSTKALTDSSQSLTDTRQYDAFGLQTGSTGSTPTPFGFAGGWGYQSDETGLQLLGHRYYDPSTGRFLTRDPVKDGRNWYGYCDNNPIKSVDPNGLDHIVIIVGEKTPEDPAYEGWADDAFADSLAAALRADGHTVEVLKAPDEPTALAAINSADQLILIGHGAGDGKTKGGVRLRGRKSEKKTGSRDDGDVLTANDIKRARGNRKLKKLVIFACGQGKLAYVNTWLDVADEVQATERTVSIWGILTGEDSLKRFKRGGRTKLSPNSTKRY